MHKQNVETANFVWKNKQTKDVNLMTLTSEDYKAFQVTKVNFQAILEPFYKKNAELINHK